MILKYVLNKNSFMYKAGSKSTLSRKYAYIVFVVELKLSGIIYILYDQGYLLISTHTPPKKTAQVQDVLYDWNSFASVH